MIANLRGNMKNFDANDSDYFNENPDKTDLDLHKK